MFSMVDAHSTNVSQTLILLGVYILNTTATFYACSINQRNTSFQPWCLNHTECSWSWAQDAMVTILNRAKQSHANQKT